MGLYKNSEGKIDITSDPAVKNGDYTVNTAINKNPIKPPVGLRPRFIHDQDRIGEILYACTEYMSKGQVIPPEWIDELKELNDLQQLLIT